MLKIFFLLFSLRSFAVHRLQPVVVESAAASSNSNFTEVSSVEALDEVTIKEISPTSIDDVLRVTPGATTSRGPRSSGESIQVRGLDSRKIFISIDGTRQNFRSGHTSSTPVNLENLKSVQVYKDASDLSLGGSLGGGILFVTKDPEDYLGPAKNIGGEIRYQYSGVNKEKNIGAKFAFKNKESSGLFSLESSKSNDLSLSDGSELRNSSYSDVLLFTKLKFKKMTLTIDAKERLDDSPTDASLDPPDSIESLLSDNVRTKRNLNLRYKDRFSEFSVYDNFYGEEKVEREEGTLESRSMKTTGLKFDRAFGNWSAGVESYIDKSSSDRNSVVVPGYPEAKSITANIYLQGNYVFLKKVRFSPGVRLNTYQLESESNNLGSNSGRNISKVFLVKYNPNSRLQVGSSYSEGFNAPKLDEVYPFGLHARGDGFFLRDNYFIPNEELKAESSQILDFNTKILIISRDSERLTLSGSVYESRIENYIRIQRKFTTFADDEDGTSQFINTSRVRLRGAEIGLSYVYDIFDFDISYSSVRGEDLGQNLFIEDLPADQYSFNLKIYFDRYQLSLGYLGLLAENQSRVNEDTIERTDKTPGYFVHNVFFSKVIEKNWKLDLRVDNLGNRKYRRHASHLFESGEDIRIGLRYKINLL